MNQVKFNLYKANLPWEALPMPALHINNWIGLFKDLTSSVNL